MNDGPSIDDILKIGFLLFAAALFAVPTYLLWRKALVEGWPDDYNGWLGLALFPIFSIGPLLYAIFYRRVKQFDDKLQQDMDDNTRRGRRITLVLYSLILILPALEAVYDHIIKHNPVQEREYFIYGLIFVVWLGGLFIGLIIDQEKIILFLEKIHLFLEKRGWHFLDKLLFKDMFDEDETDETETETETETEPTEP